MNTLSEYINATPAQRINEARERGWRIHLGTYPGPLYEATRVTARLANRRTPTHKGAVK